MWPFFLISSMVLGRLDHQQIFWQLCLIDLLSLLTSLGLLELYHLIYPRLFAGFSMLFCFTNLSLMEFQVRYLALFRLFLVIESFGLFWMVNLQKNIQLMLEFPKDPFLAIHFSYYALMTFLIVLSVIMLSVNDTTLYSKCDQSSDLWQQLELASELESDLQDTVDVCRTWHVDFSAEKLDWFH